MGPDLLLSLLIIVLLLAVSAFFSGSETGLTAITRARIHSLEKEGNRHAQMVSHLRKNKEALIGTILLGNNLVNIAASALATSVAIELVGFEGVAYVTIILTLVVLIFAEVLPKTYAINNADRVALTAAPILRVLVIIFAPVTRAVQWIVGGLIWLFRLHRHGDSSLVSVVDALRGAIELGHKEGGVVKRERDMLGSILDLREMEVGDAMTHRKNINAVNADLPPTDLVAHVLASEHTRIPLWHENPDNIIGILHAKDLLREIQAVQGNLEALTIQTIMTEPWFIPENTSLMDQLHAFRERRTHFAVVVDEYGSLEGIITLEDIIEEIVGQIDDEHDRTVSGIRPQLDGSVIAEGTVSIRDINREFDWNLPDDNAATIAGLLLHEARTIPEVHEQFSFHGFTFDVLQKQGNQITCLRIEKQQSPHHSDD